MFGFLAKIAIGASIIFSITHNEQNFYPVALVFCIINALHIIKNLYFIIKHRKSAFNFLFVFIIELHLSVCYFIYFLGFLLLLRHIITTQYFLFFSFPYLILSIFLFFYNSENNFYLSQKKFAICEAFQLMLISFKFSQLSFINWDYTLIFFMAAAIYLTVLGMLLTIVLSCSLFGFLYNNLRQYKIKSLFWLTWYYVWSGLIYIYLIKGVISFYSEDDVY